MANSRSRRRTKLERIVSSKISYKGPVFQVTTDDVVEPGGVRARRDVIHHSGSVVVLSRSTIPDASPKCSSNDNTAMRLSPYLWELPAGRIDEGETELAAAKRELIEETGYRAKHWKRILNFYASPGFLGETMSIYLATGLRQGEAEPEEDERIVTRVFPLSALVDNVLRGKIRDGKTIAGVLWLETQRRKRTRE